VPSPEMNDLILRWQKALWDLVDETGKPQTLWAVTDRSGMRTDQGIVASAFAVVEGIVIRLDAEPGCGHLFEFVPMGER